MNQPFTNRQLTEEFREASNKNAGYPSMPHVFSPQLLINRLETAPEPLSLHERWLEGIALFGLIMTATGATCSYLGLGQDTIWACSVVFGVMSLIGGGCGLLERNADRKALQKNYARYHPLRGTVNGELLLEELYAYRDLLNQREVSEDELKDSYQRLLMLWISAHRELDLYQDPTIYEERVKTIRAKNDLLSGQALEARQLAEQELGHDLLTDHTVSIT